MFKRLLINNNNMLNYYRDTENGPFRGTVANDNIAGKGGAYPKLLGHFHPVR